MLSEADDRRNRVRLFRATRGWTQHGLAVRTGLSRTAISAIEGERLVPSVAAALALARAFECRVEDLFGAAERSPPGLDWAWPAPVPRCRVWRAQIGGRTLLYPVEETPLGVTAHDGVWENGRLVPNDYHPPEKTLVMASCDPAAALLAAELLRQTGVRLLVLPRSSSAALRLLGEGLVHVAGVHLTKAGARRGNADSVRTQLGAGYSLLHVARWEEGLAVGGASGVKSVRQALSAKLEWVGREPGSGARACLDDLTEGRVKPRRLAGDHRGVAQAIRSGWADLGVCLKLVSEESRLRFLSVRRETYDLCVATAFEGDQRFLALARVVQSPAYRKLLGELPGYDAANTGELQRIE